MARPKARAAQRVVVLHHLLAAETVCYGSGKVAYRQGQPITLVHGANGTTYVYERYDPSKNIPFETLRAHGTGLLYTYGPEVPVEIDGKEVQL